MEQHPGYHMLEVTMRQLRCPMLESVIDSDICIAECTNLLYFLIIFEPYFWLILRACLSSSVPLPVL